ncbi:unnamed protein product, partial [marine sediment metagenome]
MTKSENNLKYQSIKPKQLFENPFFINSLLLFFTITLFILKLIFSLLTKSLALQADAIDSMTDIIMYIIAIIGISFTKRKPNEKSLWRFINEKIKIIDGIKPQMDVSSFID